MMGYPQALKTDCGRSTSSIRSAVDELITRFGVKYPDAAAVAEGDPQGAIDAIDGLSLVVDWSLRGQVCPIDAVYDASSRTIFWKPSTSSGRENFTLLHELGHDLLAQDSDWQLDIMYALGSKGQWAEERIVSAFAARILLPNDLVEAAFANGVTASAIRHLAGTTQASSSACLARALDVSGERMVMLTDLDGTVYFAVGNGEPFAPGRGTHQPAVERAVLRAKNAEDQQFSLRGSDGIVYRSGTTNPWVALDVAVHENLAFVVATPIPRDIRFGEPERFYLECVAGCGTSFTADQAPSRCAACSQFRCPRCTGCECTDNVLCASCYVALPIALARAGRKHCESCE